MKLDPKKTVFLIDGSSFLYRAYYGMRPLHTSHGEPVHAVYSFCRMIKRLIDRFSPHYIALVWDSKGPTTRHELFKEYKATRQAPPSDLFDQKEKIMKFADRIELYQAQRAEYEADDIMYSIALDQQKKGFDVIYVTSDKDMSQALTYSSFLYDYFKDQLLDKKQFEEKMGFPVERLPFYYALLGDTSDNIPGVRGIGKKTAQELVQQFDSLEDLYAHIDTISKARVKSAIEDQRDSAFLSRDLFLLQYVAMGVGPRSLHFDGSNWSAAYPLFQELEFKTLLAETGLNKEQQKKVFEEKIAAIRTYGFQTVTTLEKLERVVDQIRMRGECAVDTEADNIRPLQAHMVGISVCMQEDGAYYIPFGHQTSEPQLPYEQVRAALKPIFEDVSIKKYLHHAKFDQLLLSAHGIELQGVVFDSLIAASLITRDWQRIGLKHLAAFYFGEQMLTFDEMVKEQKLNNFAQTPLDLATLYAANDAYQTFKLTKLFEKELINEGMGPLFHEIEMPVSQVLYAMERRGICVDRAFLATLDQAITAALQCIEQDILALLGPQHVGINLNSPRQVEQLLFYKLNLPPQKKRLKGTGYSTDQEVLAALAPMHPVPALLMKYRELFKLQTTYIQALPTYINPHDGRVHTTFSQTRVATGRLSSMDPNLQNIPVSGPGMEIRAAFKPDEGTLFISADYSQIELRVLAFLSQDAALKQAFLTGRDIHRETAAHLFDISFDAVTHEQRQIGKRINFSILYGLTPYGLSKNLNIPFKDAKIYIDKYFAQYPGVRRWMDGVIEEAKQKGYVTTYWSRRRYIPAMYEKNQVLYQEAERVAINTVAQGTAAEIMKKGMIMLHEQFKQEGVEAEILLQIHDELLISVSQKQQEFADQIVKKTLEGVVDWNVPLQVTIRRGSDWKEVSK